MYLNPGLAIKAVYHKYYSRFLSKSYASEKDPKFSWNNFIVSVSSQIIPKYDFPPHYDFLKNFLFSLTVDERQHSNVDFLGWFNYCKSHRKRLRQFYEMCTYLLLKACSEIQLCHSPISAHIKLMEKLPDIETQAWTLGSQNVLRSNPPSFPLIYSGMWV